MILVSQGHEKSIALEVFLKSFLLLSEIDQAKFKLVCDRKSLLLNLKKLKIEAEVTSDTINFPGSRISLINSSSKLLPLSTASLMTCLEILDQKAMTGSFKNILITQPTSKDQLIYKGKILAGHTEFFRKYYDIESLPMVFNYEDYFVLLITDHIPLRRVATTLNSTRIIDKLNTLFTSSKEYLGAFQEIILSGINPHCGEGGLLGKEDNVVIEAIHLLKETYKGLKFIGPVPGDTLHTLKSHKKQLFVYMYHDQGLSLFKGQYGTMGINITFGLPFLRLSVDHGTAFHLYGKNKALYNGCHYMLKRAVQFSSKAN